MREDADEPQSDDDAADSRADTDAGADTDVRVVTMGAHFPGLTAPRRPGPVATRRRPGGGRHTSLVGSADDDSPPAGYPDSSPGYPAGYPAGHPANDALYSQGTRVYIRGESGGEPWSGGSRPRGGPGGSGTGYRSGGADTGNWADTVVMGDLGLFGGSRTGEWPKVGVNREPPPRPWFQNRARLAIAAAGLATVGFAGFVGIPALLNALGIGTGSQGGPCPVCQFPIPSSAAVAPGSGSSPATAPSATSSARTGTQTAPASPPPPVAVVPQPRSTPAGQTIAPLSVTYSATPTGNGQFTGQVTVINQGSAPVTNWQLVVALPYDTVSAVQNAEISDQNDVLFLSPAPDDLSIAPGGTVVVSIFASGSMTTPAECSFNNVPCH
jgi:Cellulose binding domain